VSKFSKTVQASNQLKTSLQK